ncbi:mCG146891 [Mus musculus]|nr:mCG146891 [Mus musculus]
MGRGRRAQLRPSGVRTRVPAAGLVQLAAVRWARATTRGHHHTSPPGPHTAVPRLRR